MHLKIRVLSIIFLLLCFPVFLLWSSVYFSEYYGKKTIYHLAKSKQYQYIFFGYTSCQGSCPQTINTIRRLQKLVDPHKTGFIFVSIDAADTNDALLRFQKKMPGVNVLSFSEGKKLAAALSVNSNVTDHTSSIFLQTPQDVVYSYPYKPNDPVKIHQDLLLMDKVK